MGRFGVKERLGDPMLFEFMWRRKVRVLTWIHLDNERRGGENLRASMRGIWNAFWKEREKRRFKTAAICLSYWERWRRGEMFLINSRKSWSILLSSSAIQASTMGMIWDTVLLRGRGAVGKRQGCCLFLPYRELPGEDTWPQIRVTLGNTVKLHDFREGIVL